MQEYFTRLMDRYSSEFYEAINAKEVEIRSQFEYIENSNDSIKKAIDRLYIGSFIIHFNEFLSITMDDYLSEDYQIIAERLGLNFYEKELIFLCGVFNSLNEDEVLFDYGNMTHFLIQYVFKPKAINILRRAYESIDELYLTVITDNGKIPDDFNEIN